MRTLFLIPFCLALLLFFSCVVCSQTTVTFAKDGWDIVATYKNPTPAVASFTVDTNITYMVDDVLQTTTGTELLTLPVPPIVAKKIYTSKTAINSQYSITNVTGEGTSVFDATGKLVFTVTAPNDGANHTLRFHLKSSMPGWIVKIPWLLKLIIDKPTFG